MPNIIYARRLALLLLAAGLAALASLTFVWNEKLPASSIGLSNPMADDPARLSRELRSSLIAKGLTVPETDKQQIRSASSRDPFNDAPFVLAAIEAREAGRFREALRTLELARQRDPRNRTTRLLLADGYFREARAGEVISEAIALDQLRSGTTATVLPILEALVQEPSTRAAAIEALRSSSFAAQIMGSLARKQASPDLLLAFAYDPGAGSLIEDDDKRRIGSLITPYLDAGNWEAAERLWSHYYSIDDANLAELTDPEFSGNAGPPFGWQLGNPNGGLAEFGSQGLEVVHYGRTGWVIARQALRLTPGSYKLTYSLEDDRAGSPDLLWRVDCLGSGATLLQLPFNYQGFRGLGARDTFVIEGEDCPAQYLALTGRATDSGDSRSATIRSVQISRAGPQ